MNISDKINNLKYDALERNIIPRRLIITVSQLIELNAELGCPAGIAPPIDMIGIYVHSSVFGLDVLIGKELEVIS